MVITTPMAAKATFEKAQGGLALVPLAPGAQQLRDAERKGWCVSWKSSAGALQPVRPLGFIVLGARAQALCDWIVPRLNGERQAGTPSLTTMFCVIGRDLCAAQEFASTSTPDVSPQGEPTPAGSKLDLVPEGHGLSPSKN